MKISFDLDGTAWKFRSAFKVLAWALKKDGHQIGIITGHDDSVRESDLRLWEARGFPKADFLLNNTDRRACQIEDHGQRQWKTILALKHGVSMHFDDWGTSDRIEFLPYTKDEERD